MAGVKSQLSSLLLFLLTTWSYPFNFMFGFTIQVPMPETGLGVLSDALPGCSAAASKCLSASGK